MRCRQHVGDLDTDDDYRLHILDHLITLENLMTEANAQQAALNADVTAISGNVKTIVDELKAQIVNNPGLPAAALDLSALDSLAASIGTEATADAPPAPVAPPVTDPAPSDGTAAPADKPLYVHASTNAFDPSSWPTASVNTDAGQQLYTFVNDTAGGQPTGASAEWIVYSGATVPVGPPVPASTGAVPAGPVATVVDSGGYG